MIRVIDMVLSSTSFVFSGKYYEQIYDSSMDSPLSPILARDVVMEDFETLSLQKLDLWYTLIMLTTFFMIIPATKLDSVLKIFNSYHPRYHTLKFTYEVENNNMLNFLNTSVIKKDGTIIINWFRKSTFSGRYINFYSNHPYRYKLNTITNLIDHAILLSNERFHSVNLDIIKSIFLLNNSYPTCVVKKQIKERCKTIKNNKMTSD